MIKKLIAPVQEWLLKQGLCVGCGTPLSEGQVKKSSKVKDAEEVTCKCGRIFIKQGLKYRRALMSEI